MEGFAFLRPRDLSILRCGRSGWPRRTGVVASWQGSVSSEQHGRSVWSEGGVLAASAKARHILEAGLPDELTNQTWSMCVLRTTNATRLAVKASLGCEIERCPVPELKTG